MQYQEVFKDRARRADPVFAALGAAASSCWIGRGGLGQEYLADSDQLFK